LVCAIFLENHFPPSGQTPRARFLRITLFSAGFSAAEFPPRCPPAANYSAAIPVLTLDVETPLRDPTIRSVIYSDLTSVPTIRGWLAGTFAMAINEARILFAALSF
jgi:hypothetical protein